MSKHCLALRQHTMCIVDKCTNNNNMRKKLISQKKNLIKLRDIR